MKTFYLWCSTDHLHLDSLPTHNEMQMVSILQGRWDSGEKQSWFCLNVCEDSPAFAADGFRGSCNLQPCLLDSTSGGRRTSIKPRLMAKHYLLPKYERQSHRGGSQWNQLWEEDQLQSLRQSHSHLSSDGAWLMGHSKGITTLGLLQCSMHTEKRDNGWKKVYVFNNLYRDLILYYIALSYVMHRRKIGFPHSSIPPNPAEIFFFFHLLCLMEKVLNSSFKIRKEISI